MPITLVERCFPWQEAEKDAGPSDSALHHRVHLRVYVFEILLFRQNRRMIGPMRPSPAAPQRSW